MASCGLSTRGSLEILKNRQNRYHQTRLGVPNVRWNPKIDRIPRHAEVIPEYLEPGSLRVYLRNRGVSDIGTDEELRSRMRRWLFIDEGKNEFWDPVVDGTPDRLPLNIQPKSLKLPVDVPVIAVENEPAQSVLENPPATTTAGGSQTEPLRLQRPPKATRVKSASVGGVLDQCMTRQELSEVLQIYEDRMYSILSRWRDELKVTSPCASSPVSTSSSTLPMPDVSVIATVSRPSSLAKTSVTTTTGTRPTPEAGQTGSPDQASADKDVAQARGDHTGAIPRHTVRFQDPNTNSRGRDRHRSPSSGGSNGYDYSGSSECMSTHSSDHSRRSHRHRSPSRRRKRDYGAIARNWQLKFSGDSTMTSDEFLRRPASGGNQRGYPCSQPGRGRERHRLLDLFEDSIFASKDDS